METNKEIEDQIRKTWFKNHVATYEDHGELKVLQWRKPDTSVYYVRYAFDGNKMYVSGDTGEAVFCFTEKVSLHRLARYDIGYFESKLKAYHEDRRDFNSDKAIKRLREWLKEIKKDGAEYDHDDMKELFEDVRECRSVSDLAFVINSHDFIGDLEPDYCEWMYGIGQEIPWRIRGYLVGLKMALEQLKDPLEISD